MVTEATLERRIEKFKKILNEAKNQQEEKYTPQQIRQIRKRLKRTQRKLRKLRMLSSGKKQDKE